MKIVVVGAGGVGGFFGGRLARSGADVTFLVRGATLTALRENGLTVESVHGDFTIEQVKATDDPAAIGPADAVLLAVKAWQVAEAGWRLVPLLGPETAVIPLENGVEAPAILEPILGGKHVLGGLCAIVSYIVRPGHIRHAAFDPFVMFGELDNSRSGRAERLREVFTAAGVNAEIPDDIQRSMWSKFLFITPMSGIGAITRVSVGTWRSSSEVRQIVERMLEEIVSLAAAKGIELPPDAVARTWERYMAMAPESTASLQRDLMEGRPSELDAQLGAVVRMGDEMGIATPVTRMVYHCLLPQEQRARENDRKP